MTRYSSTMRDILIEMREGYSPKQIKMAIGIASDKRYAGGNMTGAVNAIEKIKKGLSDHPQVAAVLKRQNEDIQEEPASPDEGSMAVQQLEFMMHAVERTKMHIQSGGDFPEWMQNKLSGAHEKMKGLYANIEHGDMNEEVQLTEREDTAAAVARELKKVGVKYDRKKEDDIISKIPKVLDTMKLSPGAKRMLLRDKDFIADVLGDLGEELDEALPPHLAKLFDKDGNFKDPKKQKVFDRMMGDGIGKEIAQKMGRIKFRVQADSAKKKVMVYVDQNDESDAQKALKNHPAYVSGALRVIPEAVNIEEGTWHMADNPKDIAALKKLMSKPIKLGKEGDDAIDVIGRFIGDDELYDDLYVDGNKNPNGDARKTIIKWFQNRIKKNDYGLGPTTKELGKQIGLKMEYVPEEVELEETKSATGYEIFHKDFSSAMQHATAFAKSKGQPIKKSEIDNKVATGPRKPSKGKENSYTLETEKGKRWSVQVYNMGNKFELNMYLTSSHVPEGDMLDEKLKVSDGLGAWIDDFKKSDAPQFRGKSDEEKKNMAIAAFTDAGGKLDEATLAKELNIDPKDVDKLKALMVMYTRAMKIPSGSPKHDALSREISKLRKDLRMDESVNEMREPYAVVDTADGNKVVGTASDEKGAKSIITSAELPPMRIKDKKTLKIVKVKKKQMIGQPIKEEEEPNKPDTAKAVDQGREDKKKTRIAQLQLQIAKAQETINKLNAQEKPNG